MQLFTTEPNIEAAYIATKQHCAGVNGDWKYGNDEHLVLLQQCGFEDTDAYVAALEASPKYIAEEKMRKVWELARSNPNDTSYKALIAGMKELGVWDEEDHRDQAFEILEMAERAAPKEYQIITLIQEIGARTPVRWRF